MREVLGPSISALDDLLKEQDLTKGYKTTINKNNIEHLASLFNRYERPIENRLYKAIKELVQHRTNKKTIPI
ncbi:MAG: hypothetical protein ACRCV3_03935 [Desulfovibrionaceae bacterium]